MYEIEIRQIIPFNEEGCTKAAVTFRIGPMVVRGAKIFEKADQRWLAMPGRKTVNGSWVDTVYFPNKNDKQELEKLVLSQYDHLLSSVQEECVVNA